MTKAEFCLLDRAFSGYVPLHIAFLECLQDFSRAGAVQLFLKLFASRDVLVLMGRDLPRIQGPKFFDRLDQFDFFFIPDEKQIEGALSSPDQPEFDLVYAMGPSGARRWEEHMKPSWDKYVRHRTKQIRRESGPFKYDWLCEEVLEGPRELLEWVLTEFFPAGVRMAGTEKWTECSPWLVSYWKTLPHATRVAFFTVGYAPPVEKQFYKWVDFLWSFTNPQPFEDPK